MTLWGIPIPSHRQLHGRGRFLVEAWIKRRTYYAITNRRILIVQDAWRLKRS